MQFQCRACWRGADQWQGGTAHLLEQADDHHQMRQGGMRIFIRECSSRHKCFWGHGEGGWHWLQKKSGRSVPGQEVVQDAQPLTYTTVNMAGNLGENLVLFRLWENVSDVPC